MNTNKIEEIRKRKKISQEELANAIGMTKNGYQLSISKDTLKVSALEKIAEYLQVDISVFFNSPNYAQKFEQSIAAESSIPLNNEKKRSIEVIIQLRVEDEEKERSIIKMVMGNEFVRMVGRG